MSNNKISEIGAAQAVSRRSLSAVNAAGVAVIAVVLALVAQLILSPHTQAQESHSGSVNADTLGAVQQGPAITLSHAYSVAVCDELYIESLTGLSPSQSAEGVTVQLRDVFTLTAAGTPVAIPASDIAANGTLLKPVALPVGKTTGHYEVAVLDRAGQLVVLTQITVVDPNCAVVEQAAEPSASPKVTVSTATRDMSPIASTTTSAQVTRTFSVETTQHFYGGVIYPTVIDTQKISTFVAPVPAGQDPVSTTLNVTAVDTNGAPYQILVPIVVYPTDSQLPPKVSAVTSTLENIPTTTLASTRTVTGGPSATLALPSGGVYTVTTLVTNPSGQNVALYNEVTVRVEVAGQATLVVVPVLVVPVGGLTTATVTSTSVQTSTETSVSTTVSTSVSTTETTKFQDGPAPAQPDPLGSLAGEGGMVLGSVVFGGLGSLAAMLLGLLPPPFRLGFRFNLPNGDTVAVGQVPGGGSSR